MPYLTGVASYPPPDPTVGGGLMAEVAFLYPKGPINIEDRIISLPQSGRIPGLPEWRYLHTPGHAPGHISIFRDLDKVLIAGDAFVTTKQESALSVMFQARILSGPPKYFTCDWKAAENSVKLLADLEPEIVATGHGRPMRGAGMRKSLYNLYTNFTKLAVPEQGRYVHQAAVTNDNGVLSVPPKNVNGRYPVLKVLGVTAGVLLIMLLARSGDKKPKKNKTAGSPKLSDKKIKQLKARYKEGKQLTEKEVKQLKHSLQSGYNDAKKSAGAHIKDAGNFTKSEVKDAKKSVKGEVKELKHSATSGLNDAILMAQAVLKTLQKSGKSGIRDVKHSAKEEYKDARNALLSKTADAGHAAKGSYKEAKGLVKNKFSEAEDEVLSKADEAKGRYKEARSAVKEKYSDAEEAVESKADEARHAAKRNYSDAGNTVKEKYEDAKDAVKSRYDDAKHYVQDKYEDAEDAVMSGVKEGRKAVKAGYRNVKDSAESYADDARQLTKKEYKEAKKAVRSGIKEVKQKAKPVMHYVLDFAKIFFR